MSMWPRCLIFVFVSGLLLFPAAAANRGLELPRWEKNSPANFKLGGSLWPEPAVIKATPVAPAPKKTPPKSKGDTDFKIIPREFELDEIPKNEDENEELPEIIGELKEKFFGSLPEEFLIDPQRLLTEQKSNDIHRFLEFHADESLYPIFIMVFGEKQVIPEDIDLREVRSRWFGEGPSVLLAYRSDQPDSIEFIYESNFSAQLPDSVFSGIREHCLRESKFADNPSDQVEKLAIELSIQLFKLEQIIERGLAEPEEKASPLVAVERNSVAAVKDPVPLVQPAEPVPLPREIVEQSMLGVDLKIKRPIVVGGIGVFLLALIWIARFIFVRRRASLRRPILFPHYERRVRLKGEHTGGAFSSISFEFGKTDGNIN